MDNDKSLFVLCMYILEKAPCDIEREATSFCKETKQVFENPRNEMDQVFLVYTGWCNAGEHSNVLCAFGPLISEINGPNCPKSYTVEITQSNPNR